VCTIAAPFSVNTFSGFQNCVGQGGEDGDGCEPVSCPFAGIGSCCAYAALVLGGDERQRQRTLSRALHRSVIAGVS
jgi:hypothetical protein